MTYAWSKDTLRRVLLSAGLVLLISVAALALSAKALAYEGVYCNHVYLGPGGSCTSSSVSEIRRAIGESNESYTEVQVSTNVGFKSGSCTSPGCVADTGYLSKDGTGTGTIKNITGNFSNYYYGYLYR
jgi:hypothetical protein